MLKAEHIYFRTYEKQSRRSSFSLQCFYLLCPLFFFSLLTCLKQRFYLDKHNTTVKMWSQTFCFFSQFFCAHRWQKQKSVLYNPFWSADKFAGKILYLALFFCVCFFFHILYLTILTVVANFRFLQPSRTAIATQTIPTTKLPLLQTNIFKTSWSYVFCKEAEGCGHGTGKSYTRKTPAQRQTCFCTYLM